MRQRTISMYLSLEDSLTKANLLGCCLNARGCDLRGFYRNKGPFLIAILVPTSIAVKTRDLFSSSQDLTAESMVFRISKLEISARGLSSGDFLGL